MNCPPPRSVRKEDVDPRDVYSSVNKRIRPYTRGSDCTVSCRACPLHAHHTQTRVWTVCAEAAAAADAIGPLEGVSIRAKIGGVHQGEEAVELHEAEDG
eukprot:scaffold5582_cov39-Phaeocystis_antarctica.AAC.1